MAEQAELSALRERVGRTEVEVDHQTEKLREHDRRLEAGSKRMEAITDRLASIERRLDDIERLLRTINRLIKWGIMSLGTAVLEALTGAFKAVIKMAATLGSGS